jgi:NADPH:quinone reductase-like Zn-dependent oxidoreductase
LTPLLHKQLRVHGIYVGSREMFDQMNTAITAANLHPVIDRIFEFDQAPEAFLHMQSASHFGKIVIQIARD